MDLVRRWNRMVMMIVAVPIVVVPFPLLVLYLFFLLRFHALAP
jgi:hypothetical protein